jgi:hypothetical protein
MAFWNSYMLLMCFYFLLPDLTCEPSAFMEQGMFRKLPLLLWTVSNPLPPAQKANSPLFTPSLLALVAFIPSPWTFTPLSGSRVSAWRKRITSASSRSIRIMGTVSAAVSEAKTLRARCSQLSNSFLLALSCLWFELSVHTMYMSSLQPSSESQEQL